MWVMGTQLISPENAHTFFYDSLWMSLSARGPTTERDMHANDIESLSHIATFMTRYITRDKFHPPVISGYKPDGEPIIKKRLESVTERIMQARENLYSVLTGEVGDFSMFVCGMFPEFLDGTGLRGLYAGAVPAAYWQEYKRTAADTFYRLSKGFDFYASVITDAHDKFMAEVSDDGSIRVVPVPERVRYRSVGSEVVIDGPDPEGLCRPWRDS